MAKTKLRQNARLSQLTPAKSAWLIRAFVPALLALVTLAILLSNSRKPDFSNNIAAPGYAAAINEILVPMGWLVAATPGETSVVKLRAGVIDTLPALSKFYRSSPLKSDLERDDPDIWDFEGGGLVGLQANARFAQGPFRDSGWTGDILYGRARAFATLTALDGSGAKIEFNLRQPDPNQAPDILSVSMTGLSPAKTRTVARKFAMRDSDAPGSEFGTAQLIGSTLVIMRLGRITVVTDSSRGKQRSNASRPTPLLVASGGNISFMYGDRQVGPTYRFQTEQTRLSGYRPFGPRSRDLELGSFGASLETALTSVVTSGGQSVRLSLDRDLHRAVQGQLTETAGKLARSIGRSNFPAATAVMDTQSGELLALATYPSPKEEDAGLSARLSSRNYNFMPLPAGSTAKIPFSAAIVSQRPELLGLRVQAGTSNRLFGTNLDREVKDLVSGEIGFDDFIIRSSNRYAASLMAFGLVRNMDMACPSEPYWLNGKLLVQRPRFAGFVGLSGAINQCGGTFTRFSDPPSSFIPQDGSGIYWVSRLKTIFDIPGLETVPQALWNRGVWGDLARSDNARVLDAVSPEQERFQLGQVRTFTNDYIHLILGGVHSRWTTIKLAEIYSRLVMNRPVSATMLAGPEIVIGGHLDGLDPEVRRRLLGAMENVVLSENGTAKQIRGVIGQLSSDAPGETIRIFAKTGTPSIAPTQDSATRTLMAELARRHEVIIDFANLPDVKHSGESRAEAFQRILRSDASLAGMGVSAKTLEGELMRGRRLQSARIGESIIQGNSVLWPVSTETDDEHGNGKVFVMVVARYCNADDAREKPVAALTLAINFQAYGGGYKPTLDMVNDLFKSGSMLRSRLMEKRGKCSVPSKPQHGSPI